MLQLPIPTISLVKPQDLYSFNYLLILPTIPIFFNANKFMSED